MKIKLNKEPLQKLKIPYELFKTETGKADDQIILIYDNAIYLKYNIDVEYYAPNIDSIEEEGDNMNILSVEQTGIFVNFAGYLDKSAISIISIAEDKIVQYDKENKELITYNKPKIDIGTNGHVYTVWCATFEEAVATFNTLSNWRWQ